jgi:serine/threonine-protein kinase
MTLAARDWLALGRLLDTALALPPEQRASWVETLDDERAHLKGMLLELLSREDLQSTSGFLGTLPKLTPLTLGARPDCAPGEVVGAYRLERQLGAGGMSTVWLAERTDGLLKRKVALKLPYFGDVMPGLIERMAAERDILASLAHPNIARLYDAGMAGDGRPYLALEFIEGEAIDVYARARALDVRTRVQLVLQVARAVAYAHAHLIVHRDIKPSNIQVDAQGVVHLLDFGIAKLLGQEVAAQSALTRMAGHVLTPEYASPEQLNGESVSTASDVYSLGVVLFELLTGARPYAAKYASAVALAQAILAREAPRPSDMAADRAGRRQLKGDLDTIVLKALKRSPAERYATVAALVEDLERYLRGAPVLAQPDSRWYRTRKFIGRNKLAVGAAAGIVLALAGGLGASLWQVHLARIEKRRADNVKEFITSIFQGADPYFGGHRGTTALELLAFAKTRIDKELAAQPANAVELLAIVGESLDNMGEDDGAEKALTEAVARGQKQLPQGSVEVAQAQARLANVRVNQGRMDEARALVAAAIPPMRRHMPDSARVLGNALGVRAFLETYNPREHAAAERDGEESVAILEQAFGPQNSETILALRDLAQVYEYTGKPDAAFTAAEQAFHAARALYGPNARNGLLVEVEDLYGRMLAEKGRSEEAIAHFQHAIVDANGIYGPGNSNAGFIYSYLARAHLRLGDFGAALLDAREALTIVEHNQDRETSPNLPGARIAVARALLLVREPQDALDMCAGVSEAMLKRLPADDPGLRECGAVRGLALGYLGHFPEARSTLTANIAERRAAHDERLPESLNAMGIVAAMQAQWSESSTWHQQALQSLGTEKESAARAAALGGIGHAHLELARISEAEVPLTQANAMYDRLYKHLTPDQADALQYLGQLRLLQHRAGDSVPLFERAQRYWNELAPQSRWAAEANAALRRARDAR